MGNKKERIPVYAYTHAPEPPLLFLCDMSVHPSFENPFFFIIIICLTTAVAEHRSPQQQKVTTGSPPLWQKDHSGPYSFQATAGHV